MTRLLYFHAMFIIAQIINCDTVVRIQIIFVISKIVSAPVGLLGDITSEGIAQTNSES